MLQRRPRAATGVAVALLACAIALASSSHAPSARGASSSTVVGATVPSATSIDASACPALTADVTDFGIVQPGTPVVTGNDCSVTFGSSNDTASLRIGQQDRADHAMHMGVVPQFDSLWATNGVWVSGSGPYDHAEVGALQDDGKLVTFGIYDTRTRRLMRFTTAGVPDPGFAGGSIFFDEGVDGSDTESANDMLIQPDGKIVTAGTFTTAGGDFDIVVTRTLTDGTPDPSFGDGDGVETITISANGDHVTDIDLLPSGKLVLGGYTYVSGTDSDFLVVQLEPDGDLDPTFGSGAGYVTTAFGSSIDIGYALEVLADGNLLLGGRVNGASNWDSGLARYLPDGTLDSSFDDDGRLVVALSGTTDAFIDIVEQPDAKLLLASPSNTRQLIRLNADGSFDSSFGSGTGRVNLGMHPSRILLEEDGTIYVGGSTSVQDGWQLTRYLADGTVDSTFATAGTFTRTFDGKTAWMNDVVRGPDGLTYLIGSSLNWPCCSLYNATVGRLAQGVIEDYAATATDWDDGASMFGVCLSQVTGAGATADWTAAVGCPQSDAGHWNAIPPTTSDPTARIASGGVTATAALRFGFRPAITQRPGTYTAGIAFEVVAPAA